MIGIQNPRRPGVQLQAVQGFKLPFRLGLGVLVIARGQVVEMEDNSIPPSRVASLVDAAETLFLWASEFQVDVSSKPSQRDVHGHCNLRLQDVA